MARAGEIEGSWSEQSTTPAAIEAALRNLLVQAHTEERGYVPARVLNHEILSGQLLVQTDPDHCMLRAWEDLQRMRNEIEKQALQKKVGAPDPAEGGGVPDVSPDKMKSLQDPNLAVTAAQILRNSRTA